MTKQSLDMENNTEITLDGAFEKLDQVLEKLQDQETSLEDAFKAYQEGVQLVKLAESKIDLVEKQVLVLGEGGTLDAF